MKHQRHFETDSSAAARELVQISTLIADLDRTVLLLGVDIETEEERVRVRDLADPAYPTLARHLRARRNNLKATISGLQDRMPRLQRETEQEPVANVAA